MILLTLSFKLLCVLCLFIHPSFAAPLPAGASNSILAKYQHLNTDMFKPLTGVKGDLSGITYNFDTDTYFVIQNRAERIVEYDASFDKPLRVIKLMHLDDNDTEDIAYLGNQIFAIVSETNKVLIFKITDNQTSLDLDTRKDETQLLQLPPPGKRNKGLEGLCYSEQSPWGQRVFYAAQEARPMKVFKISKPHDNTNQDTPALVVHNEVLPIQNQLKGLVTDLSGCHIDQKSGHLLLLSHESSKILEFSPSYQLVGTLDLPRYPKQYEGITLGPKGELILVSEPNILVRILPAAN